jgi:hypothetical protein
MRILDGREQLYQWDIKPKITLDNVVVGEVFHFFSMGQPNALPVLAKEFEGKVVIEVPSILLQKSYPITVYRYVENNDSSYTKEEWTLVVKQKPKPTDYVYTETEVLSYRALEERVAILEKGGASDEQIANAVEEYLTKHPSEEKDPTVPDWAKESEKPTYTADEVGALSQDKLNEGVNEALRQAKESGEFNGKDGKDGADGKDYVITEADYENIAEQAAALIDTTLLSIIGEVSE